MVARRLLLLLATLMLLAALAAQVSPPPERDTDPAPTPSQARPQGERSRTIERTLDAGGRGTTIIEASVGDTIRLVVKADALASVELDGLDRIEIAEPESPARFDIYADREGTFGVVVLESDREIGRLEVSR